MESSISSFYPGLRLSKSLAAALIDPQSMVRITAERVGSAVVVHAGGEIDASNTATWRCVLDEVTAAAVTPGPVVIDLDGLDFLGCSALAALSEAADRCRPQGISLRLVSTWPIVARMLAVAGWQQLPVYRDVWVAIDADTTPATGLTAPFNSARPVSSAAGIPGLNRVGPPSTLADSGMC